MQKEWKARCFCLVHDFSLWQCYEFRNSQASLTFLQSHGGEVGGERPLRENPFHQTPGIADPSYTGCLVSSTSYLLQSTLAVDVDV